MSRRLLEGLAAALAVALFTTPAAGEEPTPRDYLSAAVWCPAVRSGGEPMPCDAGMAATLGHFHRLHATVFIGTQSAGVGVAWRLGPKAGVGVGWAAPYSLDGGIEVDRGGLVLGATWRPGGR